MNKNISELSILHFLNDGIRSTFVTLLPFIAKDLSLNLSSIGFLGSAQPLFAGILALPAGFIASRLGGFNFLFFLLIIYSFGAFSAALSPNLPFVILGFFLGALGFGMFHTVGFSLIAKTSNETNIGKNMGNFASIGDIGRVTIPPAAVFLVSISNWRLVMIIIAILGFSSYILLNVLKPKREQFQLETLEKESHLDFIKHIFYLLKNRRLLLTLFAGIADSLASSPVFLFLPFLLFAKGISVAQYGIATGAFFAGSLFGKWILGRGVDKIGNLKVFMISEGFMALVLILLTIVTNFGAILLFSFLLGTFTRGTIPVIQAMIPQVSKRIHYNKIYALSEMLIGIAAVVTVILMGIIADKAGIVFVFYTSAFLALVAIIPIIFLSLNKEVLS